MGLLGVKVENYRSFKRASLELRPLTLIYGENNSGKSALLRLLPILGESVGLLDGAPLPSSSPAQRGGGAAMMISNRRRGELAISLKFATLEARWQFTLPDQRTGFIHVRELSITRSDMVFRLELYEGEEPRDKGYPYLINGEMEQLLYIHWLGLMPKVRGDEVPELVASLVEELGPLVRGVQWIDAARRRVERRYKLPAQTLKMLHHDGADAPRALWADASSLAQVNKFYSQCFKRTIELNKETTTPDEMRLDLKVDEIGVGPLPLADAGEGLGQVLPIMTALVMARREQTPWGILAMEEPESHLHPSHHEALVGEIMETIRSKKAPMVVVETHSEEILLATMLAIAEGRLSPKSVIVHYVSQGVDYGEVSATPGQSIVSSTTFDARGRPEQIAWPSDLFRSSQDLLQRYYEAEFKSAEPRD